MFDSNRKKCKKDKHDKKLILYIHYYMIIEIAKKISSYFVIIWIYFSASFSQYYFFLSRFSFRLGLAENHIYSAISRVYRASYDLFQEANYLIILLLFLKRVIIPFHFLMVADSLAHRVMFLLAHKPYEDHFFLLSWFDRAI